MSCGMGGSQLCCQWEPDRSHRHGRMQFPAVPPPVPPRLRPSCFRIKRRLGNLTLLLMLLVPDPPAGVQGDAIDCRGPAVVRPRPQHGPQMLPKAAALAWQVLGQDGETLLPSVASRKLAVLM